MMTIREVIKDMIGSIQIKANGSWHTGIMTKEISEDRIKVTAIFPELESEEAELSEFRILDCEGKVIAQPSKPATKTSSQGIFIEVNIPFFEEG